MQGGRFFENSFFHHFRILTHLLQNYHMPGQQFYDKTNAEETFCSAAEAQAAGYRASKR